MRKLVQGHPCTSLYNESSLSDRNIESLDIYNSHAEHGKSKTWSLTGWQLYSPIILIWPVRIRKIDSSEAATLIGGPNWITTCSFLAVHRQDICIRRKYFQFSKDAEGEEYQVETKGIKLQQYLIMIRKMKWDKTEPIDATADDSVGVCIILEIINTVCIAWRLGV